MAVPSLCWVLCGLRRDLRIRLAPSRPVKGRDSQTVLWVSAGGEQGQVMEGQTWRSFKGCPSIPSWVQRERKGGLR